MSVDIKFKVKGFWHEFITYRNIENHLITYVEDMVIIRFDKVNRKGINRHYEFQIPKINLDGVHIRRRID